MPRLQRQTERAAALPVAAFLLFIPPLVGLFEDVPPLDGVPAIYVYLFGIWLLLIFAGRRLATTLLDSEQPAARRRDVWPDALEPRGDGEADGA